jgi:O-acetyl-ADP-ribose deacetylase (regulator of RNase III)
MPLVVTAGDIFAADVEALVNPVNCVGVLGKGLALAFKQRYPAACALYTEACRAGEVVPGRVLATAARPRLMIFHFPTKRHWRDASRLEDIERGLDSLIAEIALCGVQSIAIPALGCGLGGLAWSTVQPLIETRLSLLHDVRVILYAPT